MRVYTHLSGILASRLTAHHVGKAGVALTLKPTRLSAGQRVVKRGMDLVLAGARTDRGLARPARGGARDQGHVARTGAVPPGSGHRGWPDVQACTSSAR